MDRAIGEASEWLNECGCKKAREEREMMERRVGDVGSRDEYSMVQADQ